MGLFPLPAKIMIPYRIVMLIVSIVTLAVDSASLGKYHSRGQASPSDNSALLAASVVSIILLAWRIVVPKWLKVKYNHWITPIAEFCVVALLLGSWIALLVRTHGNCSGKGRNSMQSRDDDGDDNDDDEDEDSSNCALDYVASGFGIGTWFSWLTSLGTGIWETYRASKA